MNIEFTDSKNGEKTFKIDSVFYHSFYNPTKEAERFIENYNFNLPNPDLIFIIEPGFSYLTPFIIKKFPNVKIICIRIIENFYDNSSWNNIVFYKNLTSELQSKYNEIELLNSEILIWPITNKIFPNETKQIISDYKNILDYAKTILTTRQYFEKKWLHNSINFFLQTRKIITKIEKINKPILITASGPSLKPILKTIINNRKKLFLISLSSSLSVLIHNNIYPDLVISTDGGFYANEHLKQMLKIINIPIVLSSESYVKSSLLNKLKVIPLKYNDGISNKLFEYLNYNFLSGERNGTVSGTALKFALTISNNEIYFAGLDLQSSIGFQHTQPNELEINNCLNDTKIKNKETRLYPSQISNQSLTIYRDWFSKNSFYKVIRIIDDKNNSTLGNIKDISSLEFEKALNETTISNTSFIYDEKYISDNEIKYIHDQILNFLKNELVKPENLQQLFPGDYLALKHNPSKNELYKNQIQEKIEKLQYQFRRKF